jgi:anti-sigma factor RsiW
MGAAKNTNNGHEPGKRTLADLSALADGTIDPARRAAVEARIAGSPELQALYEREHNVVELLRTAAETTRAPHALRARIEADREQRASPRPRRALPLRPASAGALAVVLAVVALIVVLVAPLSTAAPSVRQVASLAVLGPSAPAPGPDPSNPTVKLGRNVQEVYFPNWTRLHWRAIGERRDVVRGRATSTVYYQWKGMQLAYSIVSAPALSQPAASVTVVNGTALRTFTVDGRLVVTWRRSGHTCVLSGVGANASVLRSLAAWTAPGLERT